ncbi:MAG: hypothetical protein ACK4MV_16230 [Beijerinckiaceae bacterium]
MTPQQFLGMVARMEAPLERDSDESPDYEMTMQSLIGMARELVKLLPDGCCARNQSTTQFCVEAVDAIARAETAERQRDELAERIAELERQNGEHIQNAAAAISNSADALAKSLQAERQRDEAVKALREIIKPRGVIWTPDGSTADGWRKHFADVQSIAKSALAAIDAPAAKGRK